MNRLQCWHCGGIKGRWHVPLLASSASRSVSRMFLAKLVSKLRGGVKDYV